MPALEAHDWPASVRELEHVIERAVFLSRGAELAFNKALGVPIQEGDPEPETMAKAERTPILRALEAARWRVAGPNGAAERLGLRPTTLESRRKKLGIRHPRLARSLPLSASGFRPRLARSRMWQCRGRFAVKWPPLEACPCRACAPRRRR